MLAMRHTHRPDRCMLQCFAGTGEIRTFEHNFYLQSLRSPRNLDMLASGGCDG